ncbi:organic cation transporter protein-like [Ptychodera flava]|uniref:organic cation transporter protein-like n=1 Tax=Ptychodera flava TaxID=63121 RepID=UPI00396A2CC8
MNRFEEVINTVGGFGRNQKLQYLLLCIIGGSTAFFQMGNTFYSASADHYCQVYDVQIYADDSPLKNCTIPYSLEGEDISWDKCQRYDVNVSRGISAELCSSRSEETVSCDQGWVYDKTWYENTVVYEYNLVCSNDWMKQLSKSIVPLGNLVGVVIFGQLSDIFGRRPIFFITMLLSIATAIATSFAPSYPLFVIGQFFLGAFPHSLFVTACVMVMEIVALEYRTMCGTLTHLAFSIFYMLFGVIALLSNGDWRLTQLIVGIIWAFYLPSFFFILETPMWLLRKHRYDDAEKVLKKYAKFNKTTLPDDMFDKDREIYLRLKEETVEEKSRQYTVIDLFRTPRLCLNTILMCINWFSCSFVYYGISLNTDQLGSNPYITFMLAGFVEVPGCLMAWWLMRALGRRWSLAGFAVIGGAALMLSVPPKESIPVLSVAVAMLAKLCIAAVFSIVFVYGAEIYPTVVRNAGMGVSSLSARIGSIISPFVVLLDVYWGPLPFIVMGVTSVIAGLLALLLPETRNKTLPETLEEGEAFGRKDYKKTNSEGGEGKEMASTDRENKVKQNDIALSDDDQEKKTVL